ncbi:MAG: nucleoside deaminase [Ruminococcaceae bacterium]|jgi:tRNA(adenine34) deaminase|nr:nucleoside deaminase [Oscillospiraceae bacterium]
MGFNEEMMKTALTAASECLKEDEVPVGAVVCRNGEIVGVGRNRRERGKNALYHAEIEAIDNACKALGGWRLWECEMFVTLEPCPMCAGAIINSRIKKVTFGAYDKKNGACGSVIDLFSLPFNHRPEVEGGFMEEECSKILSEFFSELRNKKEKKQ